MYYTVFVLITSERPNKFSISQKSQFWIHFIDIVPNSLDISHCWAEQFRYRGEMCIGSIWLFNRACRIVAQQIDVRCV